MVKYFKSNRGSFYTVVAILCIANLMLGFELIKKVSYKNTVPVMEYSALNQKKLSLDLSKYNNIFLDIFTSSSSYMRSTLDESYKKDRNKNDAVSVISRSFSFLDSKTYIKTQLPAIFSLLEDQDVRVVSNISKGEKIEKGFETDIIAVENHKEDYSDKQVESTRDLIKSEKPKSILLDDTNPYIMIYHTHATECYSPINQNNYHIDKREKNVITVGEEIGAVLKEKGHKIKHIEKYHDMPSFNKSYTESLKTAKEELEKNKNLKIILDVHRDGVDEGSKYIAKAKSDSRVNINGKSVATFKMVVGPDNPNKDQLLKFARYIRDKSNEKYPGICKGIIVKPYGKFNQYVSDYYTLLEIGSNLNTLDEAKETGKLVGEILDEVIVDLKEEK